MGNSQSTPATPQSQCPVQHRSRDDPTPSELNPLNNIPQLSQTPAPGQRISLSLERTLSSIPRSPQPQSENTSSCPLLQHEAPANTNGDPTGNAWVYPSPQQFYNALVRKGWETPPEAIPVMVDIHNWMNEAVWNEVLRWESKYFSTPTLHPSPETLRKDISLARFLGRPNDLSPKARFHSVLSTLLPSLYSPLRPFDRHDWFVSRQSRDQVSRYVIDYYSAGEDSGGNPVFHFDVRPAVDDLPSLIVRLKEWTRVKNETWFNVASSSPSYESAVPSPDISVAESCSKKA